MLSCLLAFAVLVSPPLYPHWPTPELNDVPHVDRVFSVAHTDREILVQLEGGHSVTTLADSGVANGWDAVELPGAATVWACGLRGDGCPVADGLVRAVETHGLPGIADRADVFVERTGVVSWRVFPRGFPASAAPWRAWVLPSALLLEYGSESGPTIELLDLATGTARWARKLPAWYLNRESVPGDDPWFETLACQHWLRDEGAWGTVAARGDVWSAASPAARFAELPPRHPAILLLSLSGWAGLAAAGVVVARRWQRVRRALRILSVRVAAAAAGTFVTYLHTGLGLAWGGAAFACLPWAFAPAPGRTSAVFAAIVLALGLSVLIVTQLYIV